MIILLVLGVVFVITAVLFKNSENMDGLEFTYFVFMLLSGTGLGGGSVVMISAQFSDAAAIAEFHAVQSALEASRESGSEAERYAVLMKVMDANKWLASRQYYNKTIFGDWVLDDVESLEPIR